MNSKQRSITQQIRRSIVPETRRELAMDWALEWVADQAAIVKRLQNAEARKDWTMLSSNIAQLAESSSKRLPALPNVIDALTDPVPEEVKRKKLLDSDPYAVEE